MRQFVAPIAVACLLAGTLVCTSTLAADYVWTNAATAGQEWNVAGNWNPNGVPNGPGDAAIFHDVDNVADVQRGIGQSGYDVTLGVLRVEAYTNRYSIAIDNWWTGREMVLYSAGGNAKIDVISSNTAGGGGYYGNLRLSTGAGFLRFASDTDVLITNNDAYFVAAVPFSGNGTIRVDGSGEFELPGGESPYTGTIHLYNRISNLPNDAGALSNAAGIVVHSGSLLNLGGSYSALITHHAPLVLDGGKLGNNAGEHCCANVKVTKDSNVSPWYWVTTFNGTIQGTGTVSQTDPGVFNVIGCTVKPGFSIGVVKFNRSGGDFFFGSNALPAMLNIEIAGAGGVAGADYDQVEITGYQRDLDLAGVSTYISGTGSGMATNWFLVANRILDGSTFNSTSNAAGLSVGYVYDYDNNRVGAIVMPEPAVALALAGLALLLRRR
mgnify:CR=1 FL=1